MRLHLLTIVGLLAAYPAPATGLAPFPLPPWLEGLKPHQVVEQVLNNKAELGLTEDQVVGLSQLHRRVISESRRVVHDPTKKPHDVVYLPGISRQQAYDRAEAMLTPEQRDRLTTLFVGLPAPLVIAQPAPPIPPGLKGLKPHEIVEQVLNKKAELALSEDQVARLTDWHDQVADEPHRFKHDPHRKPHEVTHQPIISRRKAFDGTVASLTPAQREQLTKLFARRS